MTAANWTSAMERLVFCSICNDVLKKPKCLPCGHTFCCPCLDEWMNQSGLPTFTCPDCRAETDKPENGADGLIDNYKIKDVLNEHAKRSILTRMCREPGHDADCKYYCNDCKKAICIHCRTLTCANHSSEMLRAANEAAQKRVFLATLVTSVNEMIEDNDKNIRTLEADLNIIEDRTKNTKIHSDIDRHFDDLQGTLKGTLNRIRQTQHVQADSAFTRIRSWLVEQKEVMQATNNRLQTRADELTVVLQESDADIMERSTEVPHVPSFLHIDVSQLLSSISIPQGAVRQFEDQVQQFTGDIYPHKLLLLNTVNTKLPDDKQSSYLSDIVMVGLDMFAVVDRQNEAVKTFDFSGTSRMRTDSGLLNQPEDLSVLPHTQHVLVSCGPVGNRALIIIDKDGKSMGTMPYEESIKYPFGPCEYNDKELLLGDWDTGEVFVVDAADTTKVKVRISTGFDRVTHLTCSKDGTIYAGWWECHQIKAFDPSGNQLWVYGQKGSGDGEFNRSLGMCTDCEGRLLIADHENHRVHRVSKDGQFIDFILAANNNINLPMAVVLDKDCKHVLVCEQNGKVKIFTYLV